MEYNFEKYSPHYLASLIKLLDRSFTIENKDKIGLVTWKYFDPFFHNKTITYVALNKNNEVVSHYTNIPIPVIKLDTTYKSMLCADMATDPLYRGHGLISKLSSQVYKEVQNNKYDFSIGFSNDEGVNVDRYANNYGYVVVGRFVRYFKIVIYKKKITARLVRIQSFDQELYNKHSHYFKIKKDLRYLLWRYVSKPNNECDLYCVQENEKIIAYVILRFIHNKCYVYDIVTTSDEKKHMITILRSIENKALQHKVRIIIYNVLDNNYWKKLFTTYKYFKKVRNKVNYYLTIKIHNHNSDADIICNKENWLLMNGDIM